MANHLSYRDIDTIDENGDYIPYSKDKCNSSPTLTEKSYSNLSDAIYAFKLEATNQSGYNTYSNNFIFRMDSNPELDIGDVRDHND